MFVKAIAIQIQLQKILLVLIALILEEKLAQDLQKLAKQWSALIGKNSIMKIY
tara:strand:- start:42082 stop:42240 length:159 start_codon:yes stop_codon:yes gene_type:complete